MYRWLLIVLGLMLAGLQYRLWFGEANLREIWQLEARIDEQEAENQTLAERNKRLEAEVRDLKKGLAALEERARSEMGMIREGETFFQLIEPEQEQKAK